MHDAVLLRYLDAPQPLGKSLRHVLLPEAFLPDARRISLHRHRSSAEVWEHDGSDRLVIGSQIALGELVVGEQHLLGMRDHVPSLTTSRGDLSMRTPSNRGCRSLPCTVHSMKPTCTTSSGRTQCTRRRGNPFAFVKGDATTSIASSCV